jgi:AcrR family transcriptional regulator
MKAPSLYNHVSSKQDLLADLLKTLMTDFLAFMEAGMPQNAEPKEELSRFISLQVEYYCKHPDEVFVGNSELRSLTRKHSQTVVGLRKSHERRLVDILQRGHAAGQFVAHPPKLAALAILGMLTGVSSWYREHDSMTIADVQTAYQELALRMVGAKQGAQPKPKLSAKA